jgi:hypothetical protein
MRYHKTVLTSKNYQLSTASVNYTNLIFTLYIAKNTNQLVIHIQKLLVISVLFYSCISYLESQFHEEECRNSIYILINTNAMLLANKNINNHID